MKLLRKFFYYLTSIVKLILHIKNWPSLLPIFLRKENTGEHSIKLRFPPVCLLFRGAMDVWAVKETFIDQFYTRYGQSVQDGWVVVDIGGGIGDYAIHAAYGNPGATIYAFEPFPSSYQLLIQNLTLNAIDNVIAFQKAIWQRDGQITLDLSSGEPLQISSQENPVTENGTEVIRVNAISLETLFKIENLSHIDLLKMDCEGAEYEILMKTSAETIKKIKRIIMEYHDVDAAHHHGMLGTLLESQGFAVKQYRNFVHEDIGYLYAEMKN
jgi:FkbM family methyltransferase